MMMRIMTMMMKKAMKKMKGVAAETTEI